MLKVSQGNSVKDSPAVVVNKPFCDFCHYRDSCLIRSLSDGESHKNITENLFSKGSKMFNDEDSGEFIYIIKSGSIKISERANSDPACYGFHFPQAIFFIDGFLGSESKCETTALERTRVCKIPAVHFLESIAKNSKIYFEIIDRLRNKIDLQMVFIASIKGKKSTAKVAGFIIHIIDQYKLSDKNTNEIIFTMSRSEIASFLGITIESVSRALKHLAKEDIIEVFNRRVTIKDMEKLQYSYESQ
jgi:CRP/FNR family transcriptional regulator